jgi:hypothetical protein
MEGEILKGHLEMIVLAALAAGPAHGYGIIQEIRRRSGGAFDLPEGTIYPTLSRRVHHEVRDHLCEAVDGESDDATLSIVLELGLVAGVAVYLLRKTRHRLDCCTADP